MDEHAGDAGALARGRSLPAEGGGYAVETARTPVNILLVDDNPNKLLALETALAPLGENLVKAGSGSEALRELLAREYAAIILDVSMPVMDGFETARTIRGRPRSASTPIIFVSAINLGETDALRGYSLGAVDYIVAPIVPEVLRAKVAVFVQLHRMNEEARQRTRQLEERTRQLEDSQTQLRLAERMASLGTLAAGLGHDMGNLLLPIQARLEDIDLESLPRDVRECLVAINTSTNYLTRLASGLRLLALGPGDAGGARSSQQITDLATWWPEIEPLFKNAVPRGVELRWELAEGAPHAAIAKHLLTQLVFNLVQNAGDVLRARGRGTVSVTAEGSAGFVLVRVTDDGPGMSPEVRQRCLEPFFTTKSRTLSTGLGLAMVNGIIRRAGGALEIESVMDVGTTFTCRLPAVIATDRPTAPTARVTVSDARLRAVVTTLLRVHGFEVKPLDNGGMHPSLWVADDDEMATGKGLAFLEEGDDQRLLVLGEAPKGTTGDRVVCLPRLPSILDLRAALAALTRPRSASRVESQPPQSAS